MFQFPTLVLGGVSSRMHLPGRALSNNRNDALKVRCARRGVRLGP